MEPVTLLLWCVAAICICATGIIGALTLSFLIVLIARLFGKTVIED